MVAVCGFVFAVAAGWASCVRSGKFTGLGHWFGVLSVLSLAYMAWPTYHHFPDAGKKVDDDFASAFLRVVERIDANQLARGHQ